MSIPLKCYITRRQKEHWNLTWVLNFNKGEICTLVAFLIFTRVQLSSLFLFYLKENTIGIELGK